jgi:large exoprotein involved in heme utilization and adhesion
MIDIQVDNNLRVRQGSAISVSTFGTGNAGSLNIKADTLEVSGTQTLEFSGNHKPVITPSNITSESVESTVVKRDAGQAGSISVQANTVTVFNNGKISTQTTGNAGGGNITINASNILHLQNGIITTSVKGSTGNGGNIAINATNILYLQNGIITTSVKGTGNGGNITIEHPQFTVLNRGKIKAQADAGNGGNIRIVAEQFIATPDSLVSASSQKGISGHVLISSPESDISGMLIVLPGTFTDATQLLVQCRNSIDINQPNRFTILRYRGRPPEPEGW